MTFCYKLLLHCTERQSIIGSATAVGMLPYCHKANIGITVTNNSFGTTGQHADCCCTPNNALPLSTGIEMY